MVAQLADLDRWLDEQLDVDRRAELVARGRDSARSHTMPSSTSNGAPPGEQEDARPSSPDVASHGARPRGPLRVAAPANVEIYSLGVTTKSSPRMTTHSAAARRSVAALLVCTAVAAAVLAGGGAASAAIVATVPLGTSANYAVLGASTVTNTGSTVLNGSLGLAPGTSITGFPPGLVVPPGTTDVNNAASQQAQSDLTAAYVNAAGRSIDATTTADLANLTLQPGVYAGPNKSALSLTGPLTLDGAGDATSVFIFQTDSTLTTASSSTVTLINGAQECNVFWLVGSSATLGTSSDFAGTILALTSITVTTNVSVRGRALARNGAVTLDSDTFSRPTCNTTQQVTTTTTTAPATTTTTVPATTTTTAPPATTSTAVPGGGGATTTTIPGSSTNLPRTGAPSSVTFLLLAVIALSWGVAAVRFEHLKTALIHRQGDNGGDA